MTISLQQLLKDTVSLGGSDLLLVAGAPPTALVAGHWRALHEMQLTSAEIEQVVEHILTPVQRERLHADRDLDIALSIPDVGRFRINIHYQRGTVAVAIRAIPSAPPIFNSLNMPGVTFVVSNKLPTGFINVVASDLAWKFESPQGYLRSDNAANGEIVVSHYQYGCAHIWSEGSQKVG